MKRTFISLGIILFALMVIVVGDILFMTSFVSGMDRYTEKICEETRLEQRKILAAEMDQFYQKRSFWAHRLIPTDRVEEIEMLLHKLNAYLSDGDEHEIEATAAEIRARANLLYSTTIYHWYHPFRFRIE